MLHLAWPPTKSSSLRHWWCLLVGWQISPMVRIGCAQARRNIITAVTLYILSLTILFSKEIPSGHLLSTISPMDFSMAPQLKQWVPLQKLSKHGPPTHTSGSQEHKTTQMQISKLVSTGGIMEMDTLLIELVES